MISPLPVWNQCARCRYPSRGLQRWGTRAEGSPRPPARVDVAPAEPRQSQAQRLVRAVRQPPLPFPLLLRRPRRRRVRSRAAALAAHRRACQREGPVRETRAQLAVARAKPRREVGGVPRAAVQRFPLGRPEAHAARAALEGRLAPAHVRRPPVRPLASHAAVQYRLAGAAPQRGRHAPPARPHRLRLPARGASRLRLAAHGPPGLRPPPQLRRPRLLRRPRRLWRPRVVFA